ncbi:hypothetical protein Mp_8g05650 [Marchantia polymorpha subsp. ruderalis]|uniref:Uncharacterized protein n=1 Tax=Marchantia polymorpha TaxID=3197 RepID=A0A2R6WKJ6_MARPO|nr:hypothetical protein MARPO_0081s0066 [Marchantia polymorpha]BBN18805.1 hypothetical protein Mp_8g05650 [Marchantia polymorpha subsp. ruderalis]|eukprot:PTQ34343.1 hypothetical protein MARPO_0081s0066 [Marchantia polymorpha]
MSLAWHGTWKAEVRSSDASCLMMVLHFCSEEKKGLDIYQIIPDYLHLMAERAVHLRICCGFEPCTFFPLATSSV